MKLCCVCRGASAKSIDFFASRACIDSHGKEIKRREKPEPPKSDYSAKSLDKHGKDIKFEEAPNPPKPDYASKCVDKHGKETECKDDKTNEDDKDEDEDKHEKCYEHCKEVERKEKPAPNPPVSDKKRCWDHHGKEVDCKDGSASMTICTAPEFI